MYTTSNHLMAWHQCHSTAHVIERIYAPEESNIIPHVLLHHLLSMLRAKAAGHLVFVKIVGCTCSSSMVAPSC
jgi:hypothetical protein